MPRRRPIVGRFVCADIEVARSCGSFRRRSPSPSPRTVACGSLMHVLSRLRPNNIRGNCVTVPVRTITATCGSRFYPASPNAIGMPRTRKIFVTMLNVERGKVLTIDDALIQCLRQFVERPHQDGESLSNVGVVSRYVRKELRAIIHRLGESSQRWWARRRSDRVYRGQIWPSSRKKLTLMTVARAETWRVRLIA